jgi:hypothetical protein
MMTISIGKADAECPEKVTLTSGMVNAVQIVFSFSEHWDEFKKIAVFSNGATTLDVPLDEESKCFVPHEVLEVAGKEVSVGVYGSKGEGSDYVAIPTEKCSLGKVVEGVNPTGDEAAEPTPTVLDDLILRVENLEKNGGGGGTSGNVPTKLSELEADSISRSDQEPFDFSAYIANFAGHEAEFSFDNLTFRNMGYGSGVSFDGQPLHDVGAPTSDNDAANKKFVDNKETTHNTSTTAHNDIRQVISGLTSRLNAVANSDDTTLDQLSEIVAYIKANKSLIDSITTSKVNVSDIIDNLTTSVSNKPLSAKMGVELKKLIDAIKIPTTLPASDVYSWAKQKTKPTYTAEEVGAVTQAYVDSKFGEIIEGTESIPDYWLSELETKADAIQQAMEKAGRNKSAFLWYTDAHWVNGNSKMSPVLLNYLYRNTPMNKVNFGGDIIGDSLLASREEMKYLYEWREAIKDLPNHHSVLGNHDMFASDSVDYEDDNYRYAFLLAPEESSDMVMGEGNYYYIDNPCEKTRYLHFAYLTSGHTAMMAQGQFMVDAIKGVPEGWHIVAIAHRWWQYSSASTPTTGSIPAFETEMLSVFDAYNARTTRGGSNYFTAQDFASAKGRVEFCIAGHIHVDYDFETEGGIPVIVTTADTNQNRVPDSTVDSGTVGTTTEAAVFGIIADYNDADNTKITVVGVGRGTSRVVRKSSVKLTSISDITYSGDTTVGAAIDASKFSFTANYSNGTTDTVNGATSVSPATVGAVGNNTVTITYTEGNVSVSGTMTLVGTPVPVSNLFNKNDSDVLDTGRFGSSGDAKTHTAGQLVTHYIEAKVGDKFTVTTDSANNKNGYTGAMACYNSAKGWLGTFNTTNTSNLIWEWSSDYLTGTITIPSTSASKDYSATAYVRFCIAYTDIDSIVITKS